MESVIFFLKLALSKNWNTHTRHTWTETNKIIKNELDIKIKEIKIKMILQKLLFQRRSIKPRIPKWLETIKLFWRMLCNNKILEMDLYLEEIYHWHGNHDVHVPLLRFPQHSIQYQRIQHHDGDANGCVDGGLVCGLAAIQIVCRLI